MRQLKNAPRKLYELATSYAANLIQLRTARLAVYTSTLGRVRFSRTADIDISGRLGVGVRISELSRTPASFIARDRSTVCIAGTVNIGPGVQVVVNSGASLAIGDGTYIACDSKLYVMQHVEIGSGCAIAWGCTIIDTDFHEWSSEGTSACAVAPVTIGNNVWIGCNVTILKGVRIGDGAIIAAGSVVTRDVPERTLAAGNPCRQLRSDVEWCIDSIAI